MTVSNLNVEINHASGAYDGDGRAEDEIAQDATPLAWRDNVDVDGDLVFGEIGDDDVVGPNGPIDYSGAFVRASGTASVNIFGFVSGSISFVYEQQTVDVDADGDGTFDPSATLPGTPSAGLRSRRRDPHPVRSCDLRPGHPRGRPRRPRASPSPAARSPSRSSRRPRAQRATRAAGWPSRQRSTVPSTASPASRFPRRTSPSRSTRPAATSTRRRPRRVTATSWARSSSTGRRPSTSPRVEPSRPTRSRSRSTPTATPATRPTRTCSTSPGRLLPRHGRPGRRPLRLRGDHRALRDLHLRAVRNGQRRRHAHRRLGARVRPGPASTRHRPRSCLSESARSSISTPGPWTPRVELGLPPRWSSSRW